MHPLAQVPTAEKAAPTPGKRVFAVEPEYEGTDVYHTLYLPGNFTSQCKPSLIVEFTGNLHASTGSTGRVEDANFGYALTLGRDFIWVVLPFICKDRTRNELLWWGDENATVDYAKTCISRIIEIYKVDPDRIILCGFSRGAIAASYIGLRDDQISQLWSAFITSSHFDGVRAWPGTSWGKSLEVYRSNAITRLHRVKGRPFWVSQENSVEDIEAFLKETELWGDNYILDAVPMKQLFPQLPNAHFIDIHTDKWPLFDHPNTRRAREWIFKVGVRC